MRYRRLNYRYAVLVSGGAPRPSAYEWLAGRPGVAIAQPRWRPATDVYETDGGICITVELPGVDPDNLDVLLYQDALVVEGQRRLRPIEGDGVYHAAEIRQGPFRLELGLPAPIDLERVEATYDRGLLQLTLSKEGGERRG
jgi:HSP20 family protein